MAGSKTTWFANQVANITHGTTPTVPSSLYVALFPADPGASGTASTEFSSSNWSGYARQQVTTAAATNGAWSDTTTINFPANGSASSVTVGGWGLVDSSNNMYYHGAFSPTQTVASGQPFQVPSGSVSVSEA